jgi:curved DNA-binding protein CbpA
VSKTAHEILGVKKDATSAEINRSFQNLSFRHHPMNHSNATVEEKAKQEEKFNEIAKAFAALSVPTSIPNKKKPKSKNFLKKLFK